MIIHLFGSTTSSAKAFKNILNSNGYNNIIEYTSKDLGKPYKQCDIDRPHDFKFVHSEKSSCIVSFAPIWKISKFLSELSKINPEFFKSVKKILICSSSSVITKRYSFNIFDQNLSKTLEKSETLLLKLCVSFSIDIKIIRPTLIYGSYGGFKDKNFSKIIDFMRISPLLVLPVNSGYRQPISCFELANVFFSLLKNRKDEKFSKSKILVGGDKILSFNEMLISLKNSTEKKDRARKCFFLIVPDKLFICLIIPIFFISRKNFEALLRIFANLSDFTTHYELTNNKSKIFPNKNF